MINNVILNGVVVELPKMNETAGGIKYATVVLEITRPFKNHQGIYDVDRIAVTLWKGLAETSKDLCKIGDVLGIKGRIQSYSVERDGKTFFNYEIVAEYISYIGVN